MTLDQLQLTGKQVTGAYSSLTRFSCEFADGTALVLDAVDQNGAKIKSQLIPADQLDRDSDAVCKVDWKWIAGSSVISVSPSDGTFRFMLSEAGPLNISVQVWQGKPFLAFQPYRPA